MVNALVRRLCYGRVKIYDKSRAGGGFHQPREKRVTFDRNIFSKVYPDSRDFRDGGAYLQFIATRSDAVYATDGWVIVISHLSSRDVVKIWFYTFAAPTGASCPAPAFLSSIPGE